jgi:ribosomal protein S18 acetylase RimI-like enzyme
MKIIEPSLQELPQLVKLFEEYRQFYQQEAKPGEAATFLKERLQARDSVFYLVMDEHGNAVGFTQLYPYFTSVGMKRLWLLNDLYVQMAARGKGYARHLINHAKELVHRTGAGGLTLSTAKTNAIGNSLYPQVGFVQDEEYNYYQWKPEVSNLMAAAGPVSKLSVAS